MYAHTCRLVIGLIKSANMRTHAYMNILVIVENKLMVYIFGFKQAKNLRGYFLEVKIPWFYEGT